MLEASPGLHTTRFDISRHIYYSTSYLIEYEQLFKSL